MPKAYPGPPSYIERAARARNLDHISIARIGRSEQIVEVGRLATSIAERKGNAPSLRQALSEAVEAAQAEAACIAEVVAAIQADVTS